MTTSAEASSHSTFSAPLASVFASLNADGQGLSAQEAARRLGERGRNVLVQASPTSILVELLRRFANPLLLLLLGAAAVAGATGDQRSFGVITVMVLLSVVLDFVQEHRAGRAAERLRNAASVRATVLRDRRKIEIPATEVVMGDVVQLCAGDLVPADGRLLEAADLFVNQALLTGESFPVEKRPNTEGDSSESEPALAQAVLMGTSILSGSGRMLVVRTGSATMLGQIGASLQRATPPSPFELGTRAFGLLILRLALLMVLFVLFVNLLRGRPALESFLFAIALAVGLTPELLPMVMSVTLSRGALRMSRKKVLVKRLAAIHDLGSMDVLCTDKTGTLTEARIRLEQHLDAAGQDSERVLELAYLNSAFESGLKSPLDEAILEHKSIDVSMFRKLAELPFDFERRRVSVLVARSAEAPLLIVKGAFEDVLQVSSQYETSGGDVVGIDGEMRTSLSERFAALGRDGYRVLGIAFRREPEGTTQVTRTDEADLVFAGFAAFQDPPKASARDALRELSGLGIAIKILTGDNELVAEHVCRELGIASAGVLTGTQIHAMSEEALLAQIDRTTLFCRVTPAQKNRIIETLKRRKHVVGFLGDGINDAPALHSADVGVSVDSAVDVAKAAADIILLEHDLHVLKDGVIEGRRTLGNIMKYILMGTSSNFGNMFSMAGAALFLPFLPMLPLQILVNNFMYDLSEVPIPTDTVDQETLERPQRWDMSFIRRFMMVIGPVSSVFDFLTFYLLYRVFEASEPMFHTGWFIESLCTQVLVIFIIRTRASPFASRPSTALSITAIGVVCLALLLPVTPLGAELGFMPLPAAFYGVLVLLVAAYLGLVEIVKRFFFRRLVYALPQPAVQG